MLKLGPARRIGTPVRCPACRHPNLAIDIWCEHCGAPLDWQRTKAVEAGHRPAPVEQPAFAARPASPKTRTMRFCWNCGAANEPDDGFCGRCQAPLGSESIAPLSAVARPQRQRRAPRWRLSRPAVRLPRFHMPKLRWPGWHLPRTSWPKPHIPSVHRTVWVVAIVLAILLIVPLAYVVLPFRPVASGSVATSHLPTTNNGRPKPNTPEGVGLAGVEAKTGIKSSGNCSATAACLSMTGKTVGQKAAAILFSTAKTGGRECAAYVVQNGTEWKLLGTLCGLPKQVTPLVGRDATVHVPGNCANVRNAASLQAGVVTCVYDGSAVHVVGGPVYADSLMWWQVSKGWMAHDFLVGP